MTVQTVLLNTAAAAHVAALVWLGGIACRQAANRRATLEKLLVLHGRMSQPRRPPSATARVLDFKRWPARSATTPDFVPR